MEEDAASKVLTHQHCASAVPAAGATVAQRHATTVPLTCPCYVVPAIAVCNQAHSTVGQALAVGRDMNAGFVLLTHFSARYPRLPVLSPESRVGCAFDLMTIASEELPTISRCVHIAITDHTHSVRPNACMRARTHPPYALLRVMAPLQALFKSDDDDDDAEKDGGGTNAAAGAVRAPKKRGHERNKRKAKAKAKK